MATRLGLLSNTFEGGTAFYFEPNSALSGFGIPTETEPIVNTVADFSHNATSNICVLATAPDGSIIRTGVRPASAVGEPSGNDLELPYLSYALNETMQFSDLTSGMGLPMSADGATLTSITLSRNGSNIVASGGASVDTGFFGVRSGTFTYEFRLVPVTSAMSPGILIVETVDLDVNITGSGITNWIINLVVDGLTALFEGQIGDAFEEVIQGELDAAIEDRLAEEDDIPDHIQATVQQVTVGASSVTIDALVAVPAVVVGCPFVVASGSVKVRRGEQLRKLRRMRGLVLKGNPRGEAYIRLMRRHGPELARIVRKDPALLKRFDALIESGLNDFSEDGPGEGRMSKATAAMAREIIGGMREAASPSLRRAADRAEADIEDFVDKPVRQVLDASTKEVMGDLEVKPRRPRRRDR